jgi:hypothetical protein
VDQLFSAPVIAAAIISGSIAIIGLVIQIITSYVRYQKEEKDIFETILKEKLEKIYTPLFLNAKFDQKNEIDISENVKNTVEQYGYLLSFDLLDDFQRAFKTPLNERSSEEYKNLLKKISSKISIEFQGLQDAFDKKFNLHKKTFLASWYTKFLRSLKSFCIVASLIFFALLGVESVASTFKPQKTLFNSPVLTFFFSLWVLVSAFTLIIGVNWYGQLFLGKIIEFLGKIKKYYKSIDYVPNTGEYMCRACGNVKKFTRDKKFGICENNHTNAQKIKEFFKVYMWTSNIPEKKSNNHPAKVERTVKKSRST